MEVLLKIGHSINSIAEELGVYCSTIWRERNGNTDKRCLDKGHYKAVKAQKKAIQRENGKPQRVKLTEDLKLQIQRLMKAERWSPELMAAYWKG